mmetsp:Transcript_40448/g.59141  ORF Transcript_40448/g.59141 Transcript_40448/m.59141 type:complete len:90 (-) Transcript_40448:244-513(-)
MCILWTMILAFSLCAIRTFTFALRGECKIEITLRAYLTQLAILNPNGASRVNQPQFFLCYKPCACFANINERNYKLHRNEACHNTLPPP